MTKLNRYWTRWYEPKADPKTKAWSVMQTALVNAGIDIAKATELSDLALVALENEGFEIAWPFWNIPDHPHMTRYWISGEAASGDYCVVCAVFDAPDEETVRAEIGEREALEVELRSDDWVPSGRFQMKEAS